MPYTMEDFRRDYLKEHINELTPEERMEGLTAEELLNGLQPEQILESLPPEVLIKLLSIEQIEQYLKDLKRRNGNHPGESP